MTKITARKSGARCTLSAKGHATGSPEACAAVSALLYGLAGYLANAEREGKAEVLCRRMESGDAQLKFTGAAEAFDMAIIGLAQVALVHPEQVEVKYSEAAAKK